MGDRLMFLTSLAGEVRMVGFITPIRIPTTPLLGVWGEVGWAAQQAVR
jgi:hypothetical protein